MVARANALVRDALENLPGVQRAGFVCSELSAVEAALQFVIRGDLARGPIFCEWGSGLGAVCAVASSLDFEVYGIEIQAELVDAAREVVAELGLEAEFAHGSFLLPGDEPLVAGCYNTHAVVSMDAYNDLGLTPILVGGSEAQQERFLTPCAEAFKLISFCLSEPGAGSDVAGLQLHA